MIIENQNHFADGFALWNDFTQVQRMETGFFESKSKEVDVIDGKTMETNFNYRQARKTNFIYG